MKIIVRVGMGNRYKWGETVVKVRKKWVSLLIYSIKYLERKAFVKEWVGAVECPAYTNKGKVKGI